VQPFREEAGAKHCDHRRPSEVQVSFPSKKKSFNFLGQCVVDLVCYRRERIIETMKENNNNSNSAVTSGLEMENIGMKKPIVCIRKEFVCWPCKDRIS